MSLTISIAQINPTVGSFKHNIQLVLDAIAEAKQQQADAIIFPELALTGYPPEDLLFRPAFLAKVETALNKIAEQVFDITVIIGAPIKRKGKLFNMACVLQDGQVTYEYAKQHLPNYRVFDEKRYFRRGKQTGIINIAGHKVGLLICEDIWKKEPAKKAIKKGADTLVVLNASPFRADKSAERIALLHKRAKKHQCSIVYANLVGGQDELVFDGESLAVGPSGQLFFQAPTFESGVFTVTIPDKKSHRLPEPISPRKTSKEALIYHALVLEE